MEEPGDLQSIGLERVGHNWARMRLFGQVLPHGSSRERAMDDILLLPLKLFSSEIPFTTHHELLRD